MQLRPFAPFAPTVLPVFSATTGQSVPVPCFGTLILAGPRLDFSLDIKATGSHVPCKSPCQFHATFIPDATQTVCKSPLDSLPAVRLPSVSTSTNSLSILHQWFTCVRLSGTHLTQSRCIFSLTLTTLTLNQSRLRWFATCSCQPIARGLLSSFAQHHT